MTSHVFLKLRLHYVALGGDGKPTDGDGDGLADYFEDTNGDGATNDLTSWLASDTDTNDGLNDRQKYDVSAHRN